MTTAIEYALLAGASYYDTRADINRFPVPTGWEKITNPDSHFSDTDTGFEAISFTNGTEIVISFAGTDPGSWGDLGADLALAAGNLSVQLIQAAEYYLAIKNDPANSGKTITLTGHSLGGGLASLIAVMFGESAYTFDQAPFLNAATRTPSTDLDGNPVPSTAENLRAALTGKGYDLAALDTFIAAQAGTLVTRSAFVNNYNTEGEFLSTCYLVPSSNRIGSQTDITNSNNGVSALDLHSQALLTAFLQSQQTAETGKALNNVTVNLPDLLKMIFDPKLFAYPTDKNNTKDPNFLELIVNHEAGRDPRTNASITPDAMVTRFTADLRSEGEWGMADVSDAAMINKGKAANDETAYAWRIAA